MALFDWSEKFSVNNITIDEQHKKLISILNDLNDAMLAGKSSEILEEVLLRLVDYTKFHFGTEEKLMVQYGYPEKTVHVTQHNQLTTEVGDFLIKYKQGKKFLNIQLAEFLKDWLNHHILETDKKFGKFLVEKGVK